MASKDSTAYKTNHLDSSALHNVTYGNILDIELPTGVSIVSEDLKPIIRHAGNTVCYVTGKLKLDSSLVANMVIGIIPDEFAPSNITHTTVTLESLAGAFTLAPAKFSSDGITLLTVAQTAGTVVHFNLSSYLLRY